MLKEKQIKKMIYNEIELCERMSRAEERKVKPDTGMVAALAEAMSKLVFAYYADPMELRPLKP